MTRTTAAVSILALLNISCVAIAPVETLPPEPQNPNAPSPQTIDSTSAGSAVLTLIGDGFATDFLADVNHNGPISNNTAAALSADYLTWKLTQKPVDTNTKMATYTRNMIFSPVVGTSAWSISARLNKFSSYRTNNVVRLSMLASDIAKGDIAMGAPSSRAVFLNIGTDDFCNGTTVEEFSKQYAAAVARVQDAHPNATLFLLPVFNLNAVNDAFPNTKTVAGFAGVTPTCKDMRSLFQSCSALSQASRPLGDVSSMNAAIAQTAAKIAEKEAGRVKFLNWNVENPETTIDCTHPNVDTLQRMSDIAWAETQGVLAK